MKPKQINAEFVQIERIIVVNLDQIDYEFQS
jgi:hypothetical protein